MTNAQEPTLASGLGFWECEIGRLAREQKLASEFSAVEWGHLHRALGQAVSALSDLRAAQELLKLTKDRLLTWPIDDQEHCMCGSRVADHNIDSGHSPVSQGDHAVSMLVEEINTVLARRAASDGEGVS